MITTEARFIFLKIKYRTSDTYLICSHQSAELSMYCKYKETTSVKIK